VPNDLEVPSRSLVIAHRQRRNETDGILLEGDFINMNKRRSSRLKNERPSRYLDEPCYPDSPPTSQFEHAVAELNSQSFHSLHYAAIDDLLVYALFGSKRREKHYRALFPTRASDQIRQINANEGIAIRRRCETIPRTSPTFKDCSDAAVNISKDFPHLLDAECVPIATQ
jgi:hypothetical protein